MLHEIRTIYIVYVYITMVKVKIYDEKSIVCLCDLIKNLIEQMFNFQITRLYYLLIFII